MQLVERAKRNEAHAKGHQFVKSQSHDMNANGRATARQSGLSLAQRKKQRCTTLCACAVDLAMTKQLKKTSSLSTEVRHGRS
jgi:hypothetical protein